MWLRKSWDGRGDLLDGILDMMVMMMGDVSGERLGIFWDEVDACT